MNHRYIFIPYGFWGVSEFLPKSSLERAYVSPLLVRLGNQSFNPSLFCRDVLVKLPIATFLSTHDDAFNPGSNDPEHSKFNQDEETEVEYNADQEEDKTLTLRHEGMHHICWTIF